MAHSVIKTMMPGVLYTRPTPDAASFLKPGDRVEVGTVIATIEVMKSFQEVAADRVGRFVRYLVADDEMVMAGDPICEVEIYRLVQSAP